MNSVSQVPKKIDTAGEMPRQQVRLRQPAFKGRIWQRLDGRWLNFGLASLLVMLVVSSVERAGWVDHLEMVRWMAVAGLLAGVLVAQVRLPGIMLHPIVLLAGVEAVILYGAQLLPGDGTIEQRLGTIGQHIFTWYNTVQRGATGSDNLLFAMLLALFAWLLAHLSVWTVLRKRDAWWAVLATGTALIINLSWAQGQESDLLLFLFVAVLLVARIHIDRQTNIWRAHRLAYPRYVSLAVFAQAGIAALMIIGLALTVPPVAATNISGWEMLQDPWDDFQYEFNRTFSAVGSQSEARVSNFGPTLGFRGPIKLSGSIVMYVKSSVAGYWRAQVLDTYTSGGFITSDTNTTRAEPGDPRMANAQTGLARIPVTQQVQVRIPKNGYIFETGQPLQVNLPVELKGPPGDPRALILPNSLRRGQTYTITSAVSMATESQLRAAGTNYPPEITSTYLQLPESLPRRVRDLAIAQSLQAYKGSGKQAATPYDIAIAIQNYLRANYTYNTNIQAPPSGHDGVDYFLFIAREGYCDYYASSMAVMLRSVGIPARVVSGFATGDYDASQNLYIVRDWHAHAWVEVYFPGYGWIPFEPTPSQPTITRAAGNDDTAQLTEPAADPTTNQSDPKQAQNSQSPLNPAPFSGIIAPLVAEPGFAWFVWLIVPGLLLLAGLAVRRWWLLPVRKYPVEQAYYARFLRVAGWFGLKPRVAQTPYEYARAMLKMMPEARQPLGDLTEAYVRNEYARKPAGIPEEEDLRQAWHVLRLHLLRLTPALLLRRLKRWRQGS